MVQRPEPDKAAVARSAARRGSPRLLRTVLLRFGAPLTRIEAAGGVYILDTGDRAQAERFIAADPFTAAGLFETVAVTRWRKAYFDGKNCL